MAAPIPAARALLRPRGRPPRRGHARRRRAVPRVRRHPGRLGRERRRRVAAAGAGAADRPRPARRAPTIAAVTFANGGDNVGVYVPVFGASGAAATAVYVVVFLLLVAVWCALGHWLTTRPPVARAGCA
nr:cadmium resistance transporter [Jiangella alba]